MAALRILLIDDNPDQLAITQRVLKDPATYTLDFAASAHEGSEKLAASAYDVVLCDYRLPDMDGLELLRQLKARQQEVPFVIVTAAGNERVAVEALQEGALDYVVKDAAYDTLLPGIIQRVLSHFQERQRLEAERAKAVAALKKEKAALELMNQSMMNREERVLELKQEVNALLRELGRPAKYGV